MGGFHLVGSSTSQIERVIEEFPFPIQRIQTDRGREFFGVKVQEKLMEYCVKFRPIKPRSPHLNGKVERSQKTDVQEFYSTVALNDPELEDKVEQWQFYYNSRRQGIYKTSATFFKPALLRVFS